MSDIRNSEHFLGKRDNYWQKELDFRTEKGDLNVQMSSTAKSTNRGE